MTPTSTPRQRVVPVGGAHPVTKGVGEYELGDEQHYVFYDGYRGARALLKNVGTFEGSGHQVTPLPPHAPSMLAG